MRPVSDLRDQLAGRRRARPPLGHSLGISRVTDITGLDTLGLPVFVSVRPAGRVAQVHAGKGMRAGQARAGAVMEAAECAVAERASASGRYSRLSLGRLTAGLPDGLTLFDFAPLAGAVLEPARAVTAVRCDDLMARRQVLLPAELVMIPSPDDGLPPLFGWSTNGLAAGSTLAQASLHALLEVLERDAIAMSLARGNAAFVGSQSLPGLFSDRAARWRDVGVHLFLRWLPSDFGLPCFEATFHEPGSRTVEMARGWGIHFDRRVALARAVCEAAQVRACRIHGSQPGMAGLYGERLHGDAEDSAKAKDRFFSECAEMVAGRNIRFEDTPHRQPCSVGAALKDALLRLRARGFRHVYRYRMMPGHGGSLVPGLHVVKVIVPRCETVLGADRRVGPRLLKAVSARL